MPFEALAAERVRRRFDPDDLELDEPGVIHADISFGVVRGEHGGRWLVPDFDVDIGLSSNVELGLDGAWAVEGKPGNDWSWDHAAPDNLWVNSKIEILDIKSQDRKDVGWAMGVQFGPRFATAPDVRGVGFQALALVGGRYHRWHGVVSGGGMIDAGGALRSERPTATLAGFDVAVDLDEKGTWSIIADVGGVFFFSSERNQIATTFGPVYAITPWLDISVNGLVGILAGGDHYGGFLQISPKLPIF